MSGKIKISENSFLEKQELNKLNKFLNVSRELFNRNIFSYGIIKHFSDTTFSNFKVEVGSSSLSVKINSDSIAICKVNSNIEELNLIKLKSIDNILIPNDGNFYWLKISYKFTPIEVGTVSIDTQGNLTGIDTKFLEVLRGKPNFPVKIKFKNSSLNILRYEVNSVDSDTNATLSGEFLAESNLTYSIIGTFTPGYAIPSGDEEIYQYDDCQLDIVLEDTFNTPPVKNQDYEFYIARVRVVTSVVVIEDKRTEFLQLSADWKTTIIESLPSNPLIGIESVKWDFPTSPKDKNQVNLCWGFKTSNFTIDSSLRKLTINSGLGGVFKDTSYFSDNDFNNWRIYDVNGGYKKIISSLKVSSQINLILDSLNPDDYILGDLLFIVPPVDGIQFKVTHDIADSISPDLILLDTIFNFNINEPSPKIYLEVPITTGEYKYNLQYRYKKFETYSKWTSLPKDIIGYYDETSFDIEGNIGTPTLIPYTPTLTDAFLILKPHKDSYANFEYRIDLGDIKGIDVKGISNATPLIKLIVGKDKEYQLFQYTPFTLAEDIFIDLKQFLNDGITSIREGNRFQLHFANKITCSTFKVRIVEDYVDPSTYTLLYEMNQDDFDYIDKSKRNLNLLQQGKLINCIWSPSTKWVVNDLNEPTPKYVGYVSDDTLLTLDGTGMTDIDLMTLTTPDDGITRKLKIEFKATLFIDPADSANSAQGAIQIFDGTNILDITYQHIALLAGTLNGSFTANLLYYGDVAPNTIITIQGNSITNTFKAKNKKFLITEI